MSLTLLLLLNGGPSAIAWRYYLESVYKKGFMYKLSGKLFYIAENKTLAGKEDRQYEGEAVGRNMAIIFFEQHLEAWLCLPT